VFAMSDDDTVATCVVMAYNRISDERRDVQALDYGDVMRDALRECGMLPSQRPQPSDEAMFEILHALEMDDLDGYPDACARIRALFASQTTEKIK